jgi:hypothetical protein
MVVTGSERDCPEKVTAKGLNLTDRIILAPGRGRRLERAAMPETAQVCGDSRRPGDWRVEWFDDDGRCEVAIFAGPNAHQRAVNYAEQRY